MCAVRVSFFSIDTEKGRKRFLLKSFPARNIKDIDALSTKDERVTL